MRIGIDCRKAGDFGIGTYIRGLLRGLADLKPPEEFVLFAPRELSPLLPAEFRLSHLASPHYSIRELFAVGRVIEREKLDLFHAPHYVVPFTRTPLVVTIHDLIHLKTPVWRTHPLAPLYAHWMMSRAVGKSRRILAVTQAVRQDIERYAPGAVSKITVTRSGVDPIFSPGEAASDRLNQYGLRPNSYFLFVGNDKPHKNLERLVEAFSVVHSRHPDVQLALAGGTTRFAGAGIVLTGFVPAEDLPSLYRGAVALVQPSLEEGFGLPAVEAMACGAPVIISNQPALLEVTGGCALVAEARSVESIAEAMERLVGDEAMRRKLSARGIERARFFSWRECAEATLKVYREASS